MKQRLQHRCQLMNPRKLHCEIATNIKPALSLYSTSLNETRVNGILCANYLKWRVTSNRENIIFNLLKDMASKIPFESTVFPKKILKLTL